MNSIKLEMGLQRKKDSMQGDITDMIWKADNSNPGKICMYHKNVMYTMDQVEWNGKCHFIYLAETSNNSIIKTELKKIN